MVGDSDGCGGLVLGEDDLGKIIEGESGWSDSEEFSWSELFVGGRR